MKRGRMQAKDLNAVTLLRRIEALHDQTSGGYPLWYPHTQPGRPGSIVPRGVPRKVLLAKVGALMRRRWIEGCDCGCSSPIFLTDEGRRVLDDARTLKAAVETYDFDDGVLLSTFAAPPRLSWRQAFLQDAPAILAGLFVLSAVLTALAWVFERSR